MSPRTLNWPRRIARTQRTPLSIGHGSFCLQRVHLGEDAFDRQRVRLTGYLLVLAREGSVILDQGEHSILLREGDAALIPPGEFMMTEIPRLCFTRGVTAYYFLNQRTLNDLAAKSGSLDEAAARIKLPALPFYPVQGLGAALQAATAIGGSLTPLTDLRAVFTGLLAARPAMTLTFLKHQLFVPRFRLCVFLEGQCMGKVDLNRIAAMYPDGAAFRRDCADYLGLPVGQWLFRRRIELARQWLRHTNRTEQEVAAQLGYAGMRRFRGDMKRFGRLSPLELETLRFLHPQKPTAENQLPFWFPDGEARVARTKQLACDLVTLNTSAPKPAMQRSLLHRYMWEPKPAGTPDISRPLAHQVGGEAETSSTQEDVPDNIIFLDAVEAWQAGRSALSLASLPIAVAA